MLDQTSSLLLFFMIPVNSYAILISLSNHRRRDRKIYNFNCATGCGAEFYNYAFLCYILVSSTLISAGSLLYQNIAWDDSTRVASFWTFALTNYSFVFFVILFYDLESLGLGFFFLVLSFFSCAASVAVTATWIDNNSEYGAIALLGISAFLLFVYGIATWNLYDAITKPDSSNRREQRPLIIVSKSSNCHRSDREPTQVYM